MLVRSKLILQLLFIFLLFPYIVAGIDKVGKNVTPIFPFEQNFTNELEKRSSVQLKILVACADSQSDFIDSLKTYGDSVDYFDCRSGIPDISLLMGYDCVITYSNEPYFDKDATGNVFASYVDSGGSLIIGTFAWYGPIFNLGGRIMSGELSPLLSGGNQNHFSFSNLGWSNTGHPIMGGIISIRDYFRDYTRLSSDADSVAKWADGENFVATKGRVVAINGYVGNGHRYSGDIIKLFYNAIVWVTQRKFLHDVGIINITPKGSIEPLSQVSPKIKVKNFGKSEEINIPVRLSRDSSGMKIYDRTIFIPRLIPLDTVTVTFPTWNVGPDEASYTLNGWTTVPDDSFPQNDTMSVYVNAFYFRKIREITGPPRGPLDYYQGLSIEDSLLFWALVRNQSPFVKIYILHKDTGRLYDSLEVNIGGYACGLSGGGGFWLVQFYDLNQNSFVNRIHRISRNGILIRSFNLPFSGNNIRGIAFDKNRARLYMSGVGGGIYQGAFYEVDTFGTILRTVPFQTSVKWTTGGLTQFLYPPYNFFISDDDSHQDLREIDVQGSSARLLRIRNIRSDFPIGTYPGGSASDGVSLYLGQVFGNKIIVYSMPPSRVEHFQPPRDISPSFAFLGVFPNPFYRNVSISYNILFPSETRLEFFNVLGERVRTFIRNEESVGIKTLVWDGRGEGGKILASGVYFYRLQILHPQKRTMNLSKTGKVVLLR